MSDYPVASASGQKMMNYLPRYYDSSRVIRALNQTRGVEIDKLRQAFDETHDQLFVNTATWGLDTWEKELGLSTVTGKPYSERRSRILSKLRGIGTVTASMIKNVAESYTGGTVEVSFGTQVYSFDVYRETTLEPYTIFIKFIDIRGIPPNIDDLKAIIEEIKPAHLAVEYSYKYLTWNELDAQNLTWDELDALGLTWNIFETGSWI